MDLKKESKELKPTSKCFKDYISSLKKTGNCQPATVNGYPFLNTDFVNDLIADAERKAKETLRLSLKISDLPSLALKVEQVQLINDLGATRCGEAFVRAVGFLPVAAVYMLDRAANHPCQQRGL